VGQKSEKIQLGYVCIAHQPRIFGQILPIFVHSCIAKIWPNPSTQDFSGLMSYRVFRLIGNFFFPEVWPNFGDISQFLCLNMHKICLKNPGLMRP